MGPQRTLLLLLLAALAAMAAGAGVFSLQVLEFSNPLRRLWAGGCCGGARPPRCEAPCRTRFSLCLREYQPQPAPGPRPSQACSFGRASSPVLGLDSFTLAEPLYTLSLNFTFRWTRSLSLFLQAFDDYNYTNGETGLIEEAWYSGLVEPGDWHALRFPGAAAVAYRVRVSCQPNYYTSTCTAFCRPRDDQFGHYSCSPRGEKLCLPGWQGDNCETPVCKEGCHPTHGRCDQPGECLCRPGWRGELCSQCQPYPGCKHGYCNGSSWDCTCDTNWGGILCDQDLNYCGTHEPCQHGGTCENTAPDQYLCTCAEGFSGTDCERVDNPCAPQPCAHGGRCELRAGPAPELRAGPAPELRAGPAPELRAGPAPELRAGPAPEPAFQCDCARGWSGPRCETDVDDCASAPCRHDSLCRDMLDGFRCECAPGWTGPLCDDDVDECSSPGELGPCVNAASCNNTRGGYSCQCLPGWTGRDCAANVDDCQGQCLHGATCIDLVDDYHCACAPGWAGRSCALDVDECSPRPCLHGGECVDLLDDYRCICPVGYSGVNCELPPCSGRYCTDDRDHCAGAPCANGAQCYTAQSDYYCHCAPGWAGKNCTDRTAAPHREEGCEGGCGAWGSCVSGAVVGVGAGAGGGGGGARCVCAAGRTGDRCQYEISECAKNPCLNNGTCTESTGGYTCDCADGWTGNRCGTRVEEEEDCSGRGGRQGARGCGRGAGQGAVGAGEGGGGGGRCAAGWTGAACDIALDTELRGTGLEAVGAVGAGSGASEAPVGGCGGNSTWWWGCNVCACAGGAPLCTRLWCGLPDCLAAAAPPCRPDEVCVPTGAALCLAAPCGGVGECRRVAGRRVEPASVPAPAGCVPGAAGEAGEAGEGCARARLALARERLSRGAHVERACRALRRQLAAALAAEFTRPPPAAPPAPPPPLTLLCDLAPDDDDALDLTLWAGSDLEAGGGGGGGGGGRWAARGVAALGEAVSRGRLAQHPLLGAARALQPLPGAPPAHTPPALLALAALGPLLAAAAAAWLWRRRARTTAAHRHDEEKSNNLQNEENLRRYANPTPAAPAALYKAHNADARNTAPAQDKQLSKRALPPALTPAARATPAAPNARLLRATPEALTVLV